MKKNEKKVNYDYDYLVQSTVLTLSTFSESQNFVFDLNKEIDKLLSFISSAPSGVEVKEIKIYKN